ncbi:hypothetical protein N9963_00565 [Crocinitomicaceae bacterium]|nr:hypothetical protein [Crocinitomicaceae bacterium]
MMNLVDIAEIVKHPNIAQSRNIEELKELTIKYPYAQIFSILYLKALSDLSDVYFEEELKVYSYRISDRAQLYALIHEYSEPESSFKEEIELNKSMMTPEVKITEGKEVEIELAESETELIEFEPEKIIETDKEKQSIASDLELDNVDQSILEHAYSANYQLSELSEEENSQLIEKNIPSEKEGQIEPEKTKIEFSIDTKQSFNSWLHSNSNHTEPNKSDKLIITAIVSDNNDSSLIEKLSGNTIKSKKPFFSPIEKAKESLNTESLPISETLAKIYALQGNFPKSISAYHQLSLKYPKKKIFFAIQIKELEKKLNK